MDTTNKKLNTSQFTAIWDTEEELKAIELLNNGSTLREVSDSINKTISSIAYRNKKCWKIDLMKDYKSKLSRSVLKSSDKISKWQKERGRWSGEKNPNYGAKIVKKGLENPLSVWKRENPGYQDGEKNPSYGRTPSEEEIKIKTEKILEFSKNKIGKTNVEIYGIDTALKMSLAVREASAARIAAQKKTGTKPELIMIELLNSIGVEYIYQHKLEFYCVDFFIPSKKLVIQTDGCYWHGCPKCFKSLDLRQKNRIRLDHSCDSYLKNRGYKILRVWECELTDLIKENIKKEILNGTRT